MQGRNHSIGHYFLFDNMTTKMKNTNVKLIRTSIETKLLCHNLEFEFYFFYQCMIESTLEIDLHKRQYLILIFVISSS